MHLNEELNRYGDLNIYPMHMPGHKRNLKFLPIDKPLKYDITEIDGFDNLHSPSGIILEVENELSRLYDCEKSFISVNGSTLGVLCAVLALCEPHSKIAVARNCHISVSNACTLARLEVEYLDCEFDRELGVFTEITLDSIKKTDSDVIVITSPTYEGFVSNTKEIYEYCKKENKRLIVDSAHGAHLGFCDAFPERAVGDVVICSLHKTLPAMTQCAVINCRTKQIADKIKQKIDILETSSPSYVLMSSIASCCDFLNDYSIFESYEKRLSSFYNETRLNVLRFADNDDKGKIVVSCADSNLSGKELYDILLNKYRIQCEEYSRNFVLAMTSICDTDEGFERLKNALTEIDSQAVLKERKEIKKPCIFEKARNAYECTNFFEVSIENAEGKICAEYVLAYPPGCPLIVPGEVISKEFVSEIFDLMNNGVNIVFQNSSGGKVIRVVNIDNR